MHAAFFLAQMASKCELSQEVVLDIVKAHLSKVGSHYKVEDDLYVCRQYKDFLHGLAEKTDRLNKGVLISALRNHYGKAPWITGFAERMVHVFGFCKTKFRRLKTKQLDGVSYQPALMKIVSAWLPEEDSEDAWPVDPVSAASSAGSRNFVRAKASVEDLDVVNDSPEKRADGLPETEAGILAIYGVSLKRQDSLISIQSSEDGEASAKAVKSSSSGFAKLPVPMAECPQVLQM